MTARATLTRLAAASQGWGSHYLHTPLFALEKLEQRWLLSSAAYAALTDLYGAPEDAKLRIDASKGLLANDTGPGLKVTSFAAKSAKGAAVKVNPDGSFSYDPRSIAAFQALPQGEELPDSFTYVLNGSVTGQVNIEVLGAADAPEDVGSTVTEKVLTVPASKGLLKNDPGANPKVVASDATSRFGATVTVRPDGSYTYDPRHVLALEDMRPGQVVEDTFHYTFKSGTTSTTTLVTILVTGAAQPPEVHDDHADVGQNKVLSNAPSVLNNDVEVTPDDPISVIDYEALSELGAKVVVKPNGKYTYDPRNSPILSKLSRGEQLTDVFTYTVGNKEGQSATAEVHITVSGIEHPIVLDQRTFEAKHDQPLVVNATEGLLTSAHDADSTDTLKVVKFSEHSKKGALVDVFPDGSFAYEPEYSDTLKFLKYNEATTDTFTYTVSDGHGSTVSQTVKVTVRGTVHNPDDLFNTTIFEKLTVEGPGVLANDPLHSPVVASAASKSKLGATVNVNGDGSFSYDPSTIPASVLAAAKATSHLEHAVIDSFNYSSRGSNGKQRFPTAYINLATDHAYDNATRSRIDNANTRSLRAGIRDAAIVSIANRTLTITSTPERVGDRTRFLQFNIVEDSPSSIRLVVKQGLYFGDHKNYDWDGTFLWTFDPVTIGTYDPRTFETVVFNGSQFNDEFLFNLNGEGHKVIAYGNGGDDWLSGSRRPDQLFGGDGDDTLWGWDNNDLLDGGKGNDRLMGEWGNDTLQGGEGDDTLDGGNHSDVLEGGAGSDKYVNDDTADLLLSPNSHEEDEWTPTDDDLVSGIKSQRQSDDDLRMQGNLVARRTDAGMTINGPSLYGFTLRGNFTVTSDAAFNEIFTATSTVWMSTAFGELPIPGNSITPVRIITSPDIVPDAGKVKSIDFGPLSLSTTGTNSPFGTFLSTFGLSMDGISGGFGLALGKDLGKLNAPLAPAIPYIWFRKSIGNNVIAFGNSSVGAASSAEFVMAVDPTDPMMYVKVASSALGGGLGFGGSIKGYIPFTAAKRPRIFDNQNGPILLEDPTTTFSQANYSAAQTTDLVEHGTNGWAVHGGQYQTQNLVYRTVAPIDGEKLKFLLKFNSPYAKHYFQKFKVYYTTDANPSVGNTSIRWRDLNLTSVYSSSGRLSFDVQGNLASVTNAQSGANNETFEVTAADGFNDVTGFRFEVLPQYNSSAGRETLGAYPSGNFVLSEVTATAASAGGKDEADLFGNLFGEGSFSLGSFGLPITVEGNAVIDLDANNDGTALGLSGDSVRQLFSGKKTISSVLKDALLDVRAGFNGKVLLDITLGKSGLGLGVPVASATAIYKDGVFGARGGSEQPFEGTPLSFIKTAGVDLDGYVSLKGDVGLRAEMSRAKIGGFDMGGTAMLLQVNNNGASFEASMTAPIVKVGGTIYASIDKAGNIEGKFTASAKFGPLAGRLDVRIANFTWSGSTKIKSSGVYISAGAYLRADAWGDSYVELSGGIDIYIGASGFNLSGYAKVKAAADFFLFTIRAELGITFNNRGFAIDLPGPIPDISVNW